VGALRSATALQKAARLERRLTALAARGEMSPEAPAPDMFRVATWNVNSLRSRVAALERFIQRARPDVICLQETKASNVAVEAAALFERYGYALAYVGSGAYNGVAIASLHPITAEQASGGLGSEHLDREPRLITCLTGPTTPIPRAVGRTRSPMADRWPPRPGR
jgi:hypothetical protein